MRLMYSDVRGTHTGTVRLRTQTVQHANNTIPEQL